MKADSGPGLNRKRRGQGRGLKRVWEGNDWMEQAAALRKVGRLLRRPSHPERSGQAGWLEQLGPTWGKGTEGLGLASSAQRMRARLLKVERSSFRTNERGYGTLLQEGC